MKQSLALLLALVWGCRSREPNAAVKSARFPVTIGADHIAVLTGAAGRALPKQCSRDAPSGLGDNWLPSRADLAGLDSLLPSLVQIKLANAFPVGSPKDLASSNRNVSYYAQVAGVLRGGEHLLYINGFTAASLLGFQDSTVWRREAVVVCDGGEGYFGVLFNPAIGQFSDFHFNERG